MAVFDNLFDILLPDYLTHAIFEFADRLKTQQLRGPVSALCTIGFYAYVGQAGIGNINQVKVSIESFQTLRQRNSP
jgi:hypothetical protein